MKSIDRQAITEVVKVLNYSEAKIKDKIPKKFMEFLNNNLDNEYDVNIDFSNPNWDITIKEETKAILALIYRDYIVSPEEREKLLIEERKEREQYEKELREKYNPDNLFKDKERKIETTKVETIDNSAQMIEYKESFFTKFIKKIKNIFHIE